MRLTLLPSLVLAFSNCVYALTIRHTAQGTATPTASSDGTQVSDNKPLLPTEYAMFDPPKHNPKWDRKDTEVFTTTYAIPTPTKGGKLTFHEASAPTSTPRKLEKQQAFNVQSPDTSDLLPNGTEAFAVQPLYHGTCKQYRTAMSITANLHVGAAPDEFTYKGGFYLTPDKSSAQGFVTNFHPECSQRGGFIVINYNLETNNLQLLDVNSVHGPDGAIQFHEIQMDIGYPPKTVLTQAERQAKEAVDIADVVYGTVPLQPQQKVPQARYPVVDPFRQVVIVSQAGLNALTYVGFEDIPFP